MIIDVEWSFGMNGNLTIGKSFGPSQPAQANMGQNFSQRH